MFRLSTDKKDHKYNGLRVNVVVAANDRFAILDREDGKGFIQIGPIEYIFIGHSARTYILEAEDITYFLTRE